MPREKIRLPPGHVGSVGGRVSGSLVFVNEGGNDDDFGDNDGAHGQDGDEESPATDSVGNGGGSTRIGIGIGAATSAWCSSTAAAVTALSSAFPDHRGRRFVGEVAGGKSRSRAWLGILCCLARATLPTEHSSTCSHSQLSTANGCDSLLRV